MEVLKGHPLRTRSGDTVPAETALQDKVVALYFSASWSPPCRTFTPQLASLYSEFRERKSPFEVVYVPCDNTADEMESYVQELHGDWMALPFNSPLVGELKSMFGVHLVPKLVVIKSTGDVITYRGRKEVQDRGIAAFRSWVDIARIFKPPECRKVSTTSSVSNADVTTHVTITPPVT